MRFCDCLPRELDSPNNNLPGLSKRLPMKICGGANREQVYCTRRDLPFIIDVFVFMMKQTRFLVPLPQLELIKMLVLCLARSNDDLGKKENMGKS